MGGAGSGLTPPPELGVFTPEWETAWSGNVSLFSPLRGTRVGSDRPFRRLDLFCRFISVAGEAHERERSSSAMARYYWSGGARASSEARAMDRRHFGKACARTEGLHLSLIGNLIRWNQRASVYIMLHLYYCNIGWNSMISSFKLEP